MKAFAIAGVELRRQLRWRANIFFLVVLPMMIILLLGAAFGGAERARIGVIAGGSGPLARAFVGELAARPAIEVRRYGDLNALERTVARGDLDAGLSLPRDYDATLTAGGQAQIAWFGRPGSVAQQLRAAVQSVASDQSRTIGVARAVQRAHGIAFPVALTRARGVEADAPRIAATLTAPDGTRYTSASGQFDRGASTQLLLFIFLTSLNGAVWLIEARRLGIARRILATPTAVRTLVAGQLLGRLSVALLQAAIIVFGSLILFGVDWGDPAGTAAVIVAFCLVGTGVGVLVGSLVSNEQQAAPIAMLAGLGLAALGGSMAPLEIFPSTARAIAHVTPHAWANDAFSKLQAHGQGLVSVLPQLAALLAFAAGTLALAVWRLRRSVTA